MVCLYILVNLLAWIALGSLSRLYIANDVSDTLPVLSLYLHVYTPLATLVMSLVPVFLRTPATLLTVLNCSGELLVGGMIVVAMLFDEVSPV